MTDNEMCRALDKWEYKKTLFSSPTNDFERVRLHYEGAVIWSTNRLIWEKLFSCIMLPIALFLFSRHDTFVNKKKVDAVISSPNVDFLLSYEDLPNELKKEYSSFERVENHTSLKDRIFQLRLDKKGLALVLKTIFRYPNKPFLSFIVLLHLAQVYSLIERYNPKAIITTQTEQDFTASLVTHYCELMNIKYICVQHGEYCYNPSMAYMRFSEYYAWNQETIEILELTNTKIPYAKIYTPNKFRKNYSKNSVRSNFLKYYLSSGDNITEISRIRDELERLTKEGYRCAVRCHPRGYNSVELDQLFSDSEVSLENYNDMSIGDSISDCDYVVAYRSTVLSEAIANSMPIVIDDVTHDIDLLRRVHDINLTRAECLLSELISRCIN